MKNKFHLSLIIIAVVGVLSTVYNMSLDDPTQSVSKSIEPLAAGAAVSSFESKPTVEPAAEPNANPTTEELYAAAIMLLNSPQENLEKPDYSAYDIVKEEWVQHCYLVENTSETVYGMSHEEFQDTGLILDEGTHQKCERRYIGTRQFYDEILEDELKALADTDAVAAFYMGHRATDTNEKLNWYIRSVALSNKSGPLYTIANVYFNAGTSKDTQGNVYNYPEKVTTRIALENIAKYMNDPRANPDVWIEKLKSMDVSARLKEDSLKNAVVLTEQFIEEIEKIQANVGIVPVGS